MHISQALTQRLLRQLSGKESTYQRRRQWVQFLSQEDPLEKEMATRSSILAWEIPGRRSLVGYSPQSHKESGS